ncbi:MAG: hypothetical protein JWM01_2314 [Arthrobacter sp.]|nr:hypothetical protein [Arthrobacter sp.]
MGEADAALVEDVQDRVPAVGEVLVAGVDHCLRHGREHRDVLPDGGAGEPDDGVHAEGLGEPCGVLHFLGGPLPDAFGVAVTPDARPDDGLVAEVDRVIAHGLAFEVVGDGPDLEVVLVQHGELGLDVAGFVPAPGVQVVAGDGDFQAVIAPAGGEFRDFLEGQVGPLAGEQGVGAGHIRLLQCGDGGEAVAQARRPGSTRQSVPWCGRHRHCRWASGLHDAPTP